MNTIVPEAFNKRSFVYRKLTNATFSEIAGGTIVNDLMNTQSQAPLSGLLDQSLVPRTGFRGFNAAAHLEAAGFPVPAKPNQIVQTSNGELVLRLSLREFWVLGSLKDQDGRIDTLTQAQLPNSDCYPLYCQDSHAWFTLTGPFLAETMAKICGVDLRKEVFPTGSVAQTTAARINVLLVHHQVNDNPCFSILCDSAAAEYLWDSLLDAMQEFGGEVIGIKALS